MSDQLGNSVSGYFFPEIYKNVINLTRLEKIIKKFVMQRRVFNEKAIWTDPCTEMRIFRNQDFNTCVFKWRTGNT